MAVFDSFADGYSFWIRRINPSHYHAMVGDFLPSQIHSALDAGCGPGYLAEYLAGCAQWVVGIDISPAMIALAHRRLQESRRHNLDFLVGDILALPFPRGSFDFVASDSVLHDTRTELTLPALTAMLKPGGRIVIRDLVTKNPQRATSPLWHVLRTIKQIPRYLRQFGPLVVLRLLEFELSPAWVRHKCEGANITPAAFRALYEGLLPDCRIVDYGWAMAAYWRVPVG